MRFLNVCGYQLIELGRNLRFHAEPQLETPYGLMQQHSQAAQNRISLLPCFRKESRFQWRINNIGNKCVRGSGFEFPVPMKAGLPCPGMLCSPEARSFSTHHWDGLADFVNTGTKLHLEIMNAFPRTIDNSNLLHALIQQRANDRLCSSSGPNNYGSFIS